MEVLIQRKGCHKILLVEKLLGLFELCSDFLIGLSLPVRCSA